MCFDLENRPLIVDMLEKMSFIEKWFLVSQFF